MAAQFYVSSVVCAVFHGSLRQHDSAISTTTEALLRELNGFLSTTSWRTAVRFLSLRNTCASSKFFTMWLLLFKKHECIYGRCTNTYIHTYIHTWSMKHISLKKGLDVVWSHSLHRTRFGQYHIHTYIQTYIHTYIHVHTYIHTYIHTYTHTYTVCVHHVNVGLAQGPPNYYRIISNNSYKYSILAVRID